MNTPATQRTSSVPIDRRVRRIGCVSYLNSKPLIEGLDERDDPQVCFDVPAKLLERLETGDVDIALCPVIDYYRSEVPLTIVPAGGICCEGPTLTVRLFSRVPIADVTEVYADTDSHTSVNLLRVLLSEQFGLSPRLVPYHAREQVAGHKLTALPETMLLIGDKVVTSSPRAIEYPYQLDLGQAWHEMTGLPFMFAVWMAKRETDLGDVPKLLSEQREHNATRIDAIVNKRAALHGWPHDLAHRYLSEILRYAVGERELEAMGRFGALAQRLGLIDAARALRVLSLES